MTPSQFTTQSIFAGLKTTLHGYLEAQYHIWDESLIRERKALLDLPGATHNAPFFEATPAYSSLEGGYATLKVADAAKNALLNCSKVKDSPIFPSPFTHQATAIQEFIGEGNELVIATGTGSGKTESFLLPLLGSLAAESAERPSTSQMPAIRALLLYPMNALVNDQLTRLRRMLGNSQISEHLSAGRSRPIRFGMYTSRTPYPGMRKKPAQDKKRLLRKFGPYLNATPNIKSLLVNEGMWPSKDMDAFAANAFNSNAGDVELCTRQEMQTAPPDLLITNYSMLEYMLMRPVERDLFAKTKAWLDADSKAFITIILDEAHMYRGAAGAEVALLLRRFLARLGIPRSRAKFILTSASLGEGEAAEAATKKFAATLTGLLPTQRPFTVVTGTQDFPPNDGAGTAAQVAALQAFDRSYLDISKIEPRISEIGAALTRTLKAIECTPISADDVEALRNSLFASLWTSPIVGRLARIVTGKPSSFDHLLDLVFEGASPGRESALESLLALCNFAKRKKDGRILLPLRMHTFFRGLGGLYACTNARCSYRLDTDNGPKLLGRLYDEPRLRCECGSRVYELLTHRDCGAAYIKAFIRSADGDFLWHEAGLSDSGLALLEAHFLVQQPAVQPADSIECWLHKLTGRVFGEKPADAAKDHFLRILRPASVIKTDRREMLSFDRECPVCTQQWSAGTTKIMDLVTKGDAPFAHLIKTQVQLQPATKPESDVFPNGGRKSLLFSDGRQKAARLARDVPRDIEQDVFRQLLISAVSESAKVGHAECKANTDLYTAFVHVVAKFNLRLFDGDDRATLMDDVRKYKRAYQGDLKAALDEPWGPEPPPRYHAELLRQLGNRYYSIAGLTLGYTIPTKSWLTRISSTVPSMNVEEIRAAACHWLIHALSAMAFDPLRTSAVRSSAIGFWLPDGAWGLNSQKDVADSKVLDKRLRGIELSFGRATAKAFDEALLEFICNLKGNSYFISPSRIAVQNAMSHTWYRCDYCTWLSPFPTRSKCPECGKDNPKPLNPNESDYLRARKQFWRDPVNQILNGKERPFTIDVQEHTAQLSYIDEDDTSSTTEDYERCFKDILTSDQDHPVDVLSSTTTMEVGIDIGSLIAVGLRNVPPMRQNYQQRAGRAGRRGSSVSTVITYAQNGAHDAYYFKCPVEIIRGQPPAPSVDVSNSRIVTRHIHAALIQAYFHEKLLTVSNSGDLFSTLGRAVDFCKDDSTFCLKDFTRWIESITGKASITSIDKWLPEAGTLIACNVARAFAIRLATPALRPADDDERGLLDFLFEQGLLPTYAFPRSLCALQIETRQGNDVEIEQRPQQALGIALSEYSPGRLVVVNKKTYKIGAVAASGNGLNRAQPLFMSTRAISYVHCHNCGYTQIPVGSSGVDSDCPFCAAAKLTAIEVIQPEVVYPDNAREVGEFEDDPVYSHTTSAEYPAPTGPDDFSWRPLGTGKFVAASNQPLVMVNKGIAEDGGFSGFNVCELCGRTPSPGEQLANSHRRNYLLRRFPPSPAVCGGSARNVYLGFQFRSDLLLIRVPILDPLLGTLETESQRRPLEVALRSLAEALALSASLVLDVDPRELGCGIRFIKADDGPVADVFLHDTAAGGAGYAHMAGEHIENVLSKARSLLTGCTCDSSCRKCLRHYGNRMFHTQLNRFLATDVLTYLETGETPTVDLPTAQRDLLMPLKEMLELAGYSCNSSPLVPLNVEFKGKALKVGVFPSIVDGIKCGHPLESSGLIFSQFAVERNLPGVFSRVAEYFE